MEISLEHIDEQRLVIRLHGRLDLVSARGLRSCVAGAVERGTARIVVDLTDVEFIDSSGVGALIGGLRQTRENAGELRIAGAGAQVTEVLSITTIDRIMRPYQSAEEALEGL